MLCWKVPPLKLVLGLFFVIGEATAQQDLKQLAKANNDVAFRLLKTFPNEENVFFSPASINVALAMAYAAARGETAREMNTALEYNVAGINEQSVHQSFRSLLDLLNKGSDEYKLSIANAILSQTGYTVLPEYKKILQTYYDALHKEVDFARNSGQATNGVNEWVKQKTNNKISKLVDNLDQDTRMILLNAIYFKGTWKKTFNSNSTINRTFYNNGISETSVPMMKMTARFPYASFPEKGFQTIELPYKGEHISMVVLLPDKFDGVNQLKNLNAEQLREIMSRLPQVKVDLTFPKFKIEDSKKLKPSLQSMGVQTAFDKRADFSGISGKKDLYVSDVVHKAVIEVNEEGSEAAAATAVIFLSKSSLSIARIPKFKADHPFMYFIVDRRTEMILFCGIVNKL